MKLLTVTVPCYNSQDYMEKCINSLLPGGDEVEILIVDDGSTDATGEIADRYAVQYPDIVRVIHKKNGGHGSAVNTGIEHASGLFFKVVDSDDWVRKAPYRKIMETLGDLAGGNTVLDMLISNFVYDKVGEHRHKVMRYRHALPVDRIFTWKEVGHFRIGQYMLMHSVIFRTKLLRECGLKLPEHTFYVDNIYVFDPLPYVKNMYYLDVNFYHYFIGRNGQSVQQETMIRRIDQQIRVNKMMIDYLTDHMNMITARKRCYQYMVSYLEIVTAVTSVMLICSGTKENLDKKKELWAYLKKRNFIVYMKLRFSVIGNATHMPGKSGRKMTVGGYKIAQRVFNFN